MFINPHVKIDQRPFMTSSPTEAGGELIPACAETIIRKVSDND